jgi:hypothetical protein
VLFVFLFGLMIGGFVLASSSETTVKAE